MTSQTKADRLPWFHCYPSALLGALSAMTADEQLVYMTTLLRIYETRGPIRDDDQALARRTGLSIRKVAAAKARLVVTGKLIEIADGAYTNPVAQSEIEIGEEDAKTISAKRSVAAKSRWQKIKQNQQTGGASAAHEHCTNMQTDADSDSEIDEGSQVEAQTPSSPLNLSSNTSFVPSGEGTDPTVEAERKAKRQARPYTAKFEKFWKDYPRDANMSKAEAFDAWRKLSADDHDLAINSLPAFCAYCRKKPNYEPPHACKYLKARRFDGHAQAATTKPKIITVMFGTPDWDRLRAIIVDAKDTRRLRDMNDFADKRAPYPVPSEYLATIH